MFVYIITGFETYNKNAGIVYAVPKEIYAMLRFEGRGNDKTEICI